MAEAHGYPADEECENKKRHGEMTQAPNDHLTIDMAQLQWIATVLFSHDVMTCFHKMSFAALVVGPLWQNLPVMAMRTPTMTPQNDS